MPLYEIHDSALAKIRQTTFAAEGTQERRDLQPLIRDNISVLDSDLMVLAEEFGEWDASKRRIDLLCLDSDANLVVVELKRTETGGAMDLQALRYAAMVSTMTFEQAVRTHANFLEAVGRGEKDAEAEILNFLGWDTPEDGDFAPDVRIILASASFSKELTTSVLWLTQRDIDIRCVQLRPYSHGGAILLDVQHVLPLPAAEEYQVRVREKERRERQSRRSGRDLTRFDVTTGGTEHQQMSKRGALHTIVTFLCSKGRSPEDIASAIPWKKIWWKERGEHDHESFVEAAAENAERGVFSPRRWYCKDGELIQHGGDTYAFSSQWGRRAHEAMMNLEERFGSDGLAVEVHDAADG